jgi:hypothetical protein
MLAIWVIEAKHLQIMKLNHINLVIPYVVNAINLIEQYFEFKCVKNKGSNAIAIPGLPASSFFIFFLTNVNVFGAVSGGPLCHKIK